MKTLKHAAQSGSVTQPEPAPGKMISLYLAVMLLGFDVAHAQENAATGDSLAETHLEAVRIEGSTPAEQSRKKLREVAGNTSVVDSAQVERGRASNAEDWLAFQPGVFAQATSGNGANKISIRGSGLNTFYQGYSLGIKYLYDGLPITGPGGTQEDLLTLSAVNYTEVLRGANAFSYTALALGGAINFTTHTGYSQPGIYGRLEAGSFGYRKYQLSVGDTTDNADYYLSVLRNEREGFQDNTPNEGKDFIGNFGYRFNERLDTRLIVRYRKEQLENGSTLTKAQLQNDPSFSRLRAGRLKEGTTFIASKTSYTFDDDSQFEFGLAYNDYPLHNGWKYSATPQDWRSTDTSLSLRYLRVGDHLFGRPSNTTLSFSNTYQKGDVHGYNRSDGSLRQYTDYTGTRDTVFAASNETALTDRFRLSSGLSLVNIVRDVRIKYTTLPNDTSFPLEVDYNKWDVAPRLGFLYQYNPAVQVFGNLSRSIDPPVTWYYASTGNGYARPLKPQKGTTLELGVRGSSGIFDSSLTVYRTKVKDELLSVTIIPATATSDAVVANSNASPTIHQGVEASLSSKLWESNGGSNVALRQAYTFNDFHYQNDKIFGHKQLPGLPRHVYQAELQYQHTSGFYASLNLRAASGYYVDFANTLKAPAYNIWGAKVGYESPGKRWSIFLDARNLTDKHYATATSTAYDLKGQDGAYFFPGDGFGVTAGISYRY
jgi:iron complex outermembrane receptor protein